MFAVDFEFHPHKSWLRGLVTRGQETVKTGLPKLLMVNHRYLLLALTQSRLSDSQSLFIFLRGSVMERTLCVFLLVFSLQPLALCQAQAVDTDGDGLHDLLDVGV